MFELRPYRKNEVQNAMYYNPFREMEEMERRFFRDPFAMFDSNELAMFKTDISDQGNAYLIEADLPGFDKKDIRLDLNGDTLTIHAERHSESEQKEHKDKYLRVERSYGSYSRAFDVSLVDTENIKAKYEDGVLKLTLPKKQKVEPEKRTLEIE